MQIKLPRGVQIGRFQVDSDLLYYRSRRSRTLRLVVPTTLQYDVLHANHDIPIAGHSGFERTFARLKPRYYWLNQRRDVEWYCRSCEVCQKRKPTSKGKAPLLSDQGTNFTGKVIRDVCRLLDGRKIQTTAYRPQTDGLTERYNRTLVDMLACFGGFSFGARRGARTHDPEIKSLVLRETEDRPLVENTPHPYWGRGTIGDSGQNKLGEILMLIRNGKRDLPMLLGDSMVQRLSRNSDAEKLPWNLVFWSGADLPFLYRLLKITAVDGSEIIFWCGTSSLAADSIFAAGPSGPRLNQREQTLLRTSPGHSVFKMALELKKIKQANPHIKLSVMHLLPRFDQFTADCEVSKFQMGVHEFNAHLHDINKNLKETFCCHHYFFSGQTVRSHLFSDKRRQP